MQQRNPPDLARPRPRSRLASAAGGLIGSGAGHGGTGSSANASSTAAAVGRLAVQPQLPPRSTKVSEKLVLLPEEGVEPQLEEEEEEEEEEHEIGDETVDEELVQRVAREKDLDPDSVRHTLLTQKKRLHGDFGVDNDLAPLLAEEERMRRRVTGPERAKSYAERLPKARRAEKLARVTAYCTAQAYKMSSISSFVRDRHGGRSKLYDDCLYTAYHLPLLPGNDGYRVRSSPVVKKPGGKSLLDEEIERNELRDYHDEYMESTEHAVFDTRSHAEDHGEHGHNGHHEVADVHRDTTSDDHLSPNSAGPTSLPYSVAEMFVFSYGVVVFWNLSAKQEKDILADLAFATSSATGSPITLATLPLLEEDFETEEFHFEYSTEISRPRIYNDMITLRSGDHMIKLAISHGIAQSTKLCFFEEVMARQMAEAKDVPRRLAMNGTLGMKREEVFRILGRLFKSRVEVNLCTFIPSLALQFIRVKKHH